MTQPRHAPRLERPSSSRTPAEHGRKIFSRIAACDHRRTCRRRHRSCTSTTAKRVDVTSATSSTSPALAITGDACDMTHSHRRATMPSHHRRDDGTRRTPFFRTCGERPCGVTRNTSRSQRRACGHARFELRCGARAAIDTASNERHAHATDTRDRCEAQREARSHDESERCPSPQQSTGTRRTRALKRKRAGRTGPSIDTGAAWARQSSSFSIASA